MSLQLFKFLPLFLTITIRVQVQLLLNLTPLKKYYYYYLQSTANQLLFSSTKISITKRVVTKSSLKNVGPLNCFELGSLSSFSGGNSELTSLELTLALRDPQYYLRVNRWLIWTGKLVSILIIFYSRTLSTSIVYWWSTQEQNVNKGSTDGVNE